MSETFTPRKSVTQKPARVAESADSKNGNYSHALMNGSSITAPRKAPQGLFKIAGFFLCVGLVAIVLHLLINHGLRSIKVSKFGSLNKVISGQVNADIVISGSSRALCHYDPEIIGKTTGQSAYNIGMNASQIDLQLAIFKTYLAHNKKPKLVIQNLDAFSFETTAKGDIYDPGYYIPYLSEDYLYTFLRGIEPSVWKWKYIPLYAYAVEDMRFTWVWGFFGLMGINGAEDYHLGFNPRPTQWNNDFANFKASNNQGVTYKIEPKGIQCLEELIQLCQQQNIRLLLVFSPEYSEMQKLEKNRSEIMGMFKTLAQRHQVPFWDFSASEISERRELFNNSQHLNVEGAIIFSTEIGQRLAAERKTP